MEKNQARDGQAGLFVLGEALTAVSVEGVLFNRLG